MNILSDELFFKIMIKGTLVMDIYDEFKIKAVNKLSKELKEFKGGSQKSKAVKNAVYDALCVFAGQDGEFAQSIVQSKNTLSEACEAAVKGCGESISDFEVYQKAVEKYFPGAKVRFNMSIDLIGDAGTGTGSQKQIDLDLCDLLGL